MEALARTILRGKYDQIPSMYSPRSPLDLPYISPISPRYDQIPSMYSKGLRDAVARLLTPALPQP